ncbi:hypothetical protein [Actinotalea sp. K2]|uniref:hypothetical protein n=1 Tax=Actinotalea sp. K2 TaxID=2939438 RepID=UPI002017F9C2|nr:hypothetical protein [Actinotalea sp. K2]MCL3860654.1 hypothetical protein [Actinotalea sp. K2]
MTALLGGTANPLGAVVQFIYAPISHVAEALVSALAVIPASAPLPDALSLLLPLESPWSRILLAPCGAWTAVVNNGLHGGDSTAPGPATSRALNVQCVVASAVPRYGPGHEQTQLEVFGPEGEPPLMYRRSLSATATDGRWEWYESGTPFEFEATERYTARRKRDRFDRELLLDYLEHLGIPARTDSAYGPAVLLQERAQYERRTMTLDEARADFR